MSRSTANNSDLILYSVRNDGFAHTLFMIASAKVAPALRQFSRIRIDRPEHLVGIVRLNDFFREDGEAHEYVNSYEGIYQLLMVARVIGVEDEYIARAIHNIHADSLLSSCDLGYLWLLNRECPLLGNIPYYLKQVKTSDDYKRLIVDIAAILRNDSVQLVEAMCYFESINFASLFDNVDTETLQTCQLLDTFRRITASEVMLINPFAIEDYFRYAPQTGGAWSIPKYATKLRPGDRTIVSKADALRCFQEFTFGILDKPVQGAGTFPWDNVVVSGGSLALILDPTVDISRARQSDLDLFVHGKNHDERLRVLQELLRWFDGPDTYYAIIGCVVSVYIVGMKRKIQIVSSISNSKYEVIGRFDTSHVQWCYVDGDFYGTPAACESLRTRRTRCVKLGRAKAARFVKAMVRGYSVAHSDELRDHFNMDALVDPTNNITAQAIRDMSGWYYPERMPELDSDEEEAFIMNRVEKDAGATAVCRNSVDVLKYVVVGGNFDVDYKPLDYTTFNPANICPIHFGRYGPARSLRTIRGYAKVQSGRVRVRSVIMGEVYIEIEVDNPDPQGYAVFCANIDSVVCPGATAVYPCNDERIVMRVSQQQAKTLAVNGGTMLYNQRGLPMDIMSELRQGDDVIVTFAICAARGPRGIAVDFNVTRVIKFTPHGGAPAADSASSASSESEETLSDTDSDDGNIGYTD